MGTSQTDLLSARLSSLANGVVILVLAGITSQLRGAHFASSKSQVGLVEGNYLGILELADGKWSEWSRLVNNEVLRPLLLRSD